MTKKFFGLPTALDAKLLQDQDFVNKLIDISKNKLYIMIKGEDMVNNVNELTGKEWLHNAINFWTMDSDNIEAIYDKIKGFCYKDRTQTGYIKNIDEIIVNSADFTFNFIQ